MSCLWSDQTEFVALFIVLIGGLIQVVILSFAVNFIFFHSHFPVTTLGLDLFSGTYLNKLLLNLMWF